MKFDKRFWKNKKVFITGHTGFKGTWLSIILSLLGAKISGYSLKPRKKSLFNQANIKKSLNSSTIADIRNFSLLKKKIYQFKPDVIFHLAAQPLVLQSYKDPKNTYETNIIGTVNLLEAIKKIKSIKSVVIITTDKVYKINKKNIKYSELAELGGNDPYSASKASVELIVNSYIKSFFNDNKKNTVISTARSGNVIGGGDYSENRLLPDIIQSIELKKKLTIRNPKSIRPWQHVIEPLIGYLILAEKQFKKILPRNEMNWNFGPNNSSFKKVIEIVKIVKKMINFDYTIKENKKLKETDILKLNSSKANKKLNWTSSISLKDTLKLTIEWNFKVNKKKIEAKEVCEKQFLMYIENK